jgi:hypothetical protein
MEIRAIIDDGEQLDHSESENAKRGPQAGLPSTLNDGQSARAL